MENNFNGSTNILGCYDYQIIWGNWINMQILILQNQHSGKDTHMRQVKIFGPREKINQGLGFPDFKTPDITQFFSVR